MPLVVYWPGIFSAMKANNFYFPNIESVASHIHSAAIAEAVQDHDAWVSIEQILVEG